MDRIKLLDHGHVGLVDSMGGDLAVVRSARVSHDAEWRAGEDKDSDTRLIRYLWRNGHTTPFESTVVTLDVKAPIFVLRQWHRHRTQSYNELSARYRPLPEEFYVPESHLIGTQSEGHKQMREVLSAEEFEQLDGVSKGVARVIRSALSDANKASFKGYQALLANGAPRELARSVLPVSTYSHMFTTVNLLNLFRFLKERLHPHAQYEIRVYAEAILELIEPVAPVAVAAFKDGLGEEN